MKTNKGATPAKQWLTEKELAERLGLSTSAVSERRRTGGDLPRHTTTGERSHMYRLDDVEAWQDARTMDVNGEWAAKLIEKSRVARDELAGTSKLLELGQFTVAVRSLAERKAVLAVCPEQLTVLDLVAECQLAGCLEQVTWSGRLTDDELRAVLVALGTLTRQQPSGLEQANRQLSQVEVLAAVVIGAVEANLNAA